MSKKEKNHWIIYHLEAMNYAQKQMNNKLSKLPSSHTLHKYDAQGLRKIISDLKEIIKWYEHKIIYHQEKAISHIPENEKTKWAKKSRELENKSYENFFISGDKLMNQEVSSDEFKTHEEG